MQSPIGAFCHNDYVQIEYYISNLVRVEGFVYTMDNEYVNLVNILNPKGGQIVTHYPVPLNCILSLNVISSIDYDLGI